MLSVLAAEKSVPRPIFYCNAVGGNDQLVFDGNSLAVDATGDAVERSSRLSRRNWRSWNGMPRLRAGRSFEPVFPTEPEELFSRRFLSGTRDYLHKCGFKSVVLGLSGGIDSAVTACIAAEALGVEHVLGVTMPTQYSSQGSIDDSLVIAKNLGIRFLTISIQQSFEVFREQFRDIFVGLPEDTTEENMQPRLRGMTLMWRCPNKFGSLPCSPRATRASWPWAIARFTATCAAASP